MYQCRVHTHIRTHIYVLRERAVQAGGPITAIIVPLHQHGVVELVPQTAPLEGEQEVGHLAVGLCVEAGHVVDQSLSIK